MRGIHILDMGLAVEWRCRQWHISAFAIWGHGRQTVCAHPVSCMRWGIRVDNLMTPTKSQPKRQLRPDPYDIRLRMSLFCHVHVHVGPLNPLGAPVRACEQSQLFPPLEW